MRTSLFLLLACSLAACASFGPRDELITRPMPGLEAVPPPEPPTEADHATVAAARAAVARLLDAQARGIWSLWVEGLQGEAPAVEALLRSRDTLDALRRVRWAATGAEARRLRRLERFVVGELIAAEEEAHPERWRWKQASFAYGGSRLLLRELPAHLAAEPDPEQRRAIGAAATPALLDEAAAAEESRALLEARIRSLGYEGFLELHALADEAGLPLAAFAEEVLDGTDELWQRTFHTLVQRQLGMAPEEVRWVDLPRLAGSAGLQVRLRATQPLEALRRTLASLGDPQGELPLIQEEGELAMARPLALPFAAEVRLALPPGGGDRVSLLFREAGLALHHAHRSADALPLGNEDVAEAWARLFEGLTADSEWLREVGGFTEAEARTRARAMAVRRLFDLRTQAAWIAFEQRVQREGLDAAAAREALRRGMERAWALPLDEAAVGRLLLERDPFLAMADRFRGELLAAHLAAALGSAWWKDPGVAERLPALWRAGQAGAAVLLEAVGEGALQPGPVLDELHRLLGPVGASDPGAGVPGSGESGGGGAAGDADDLHGERMPRGHPGEGDAAARLQTLRSTRPLR